MSSAPEYLAPFAGTIVVVDLDGPWIVFGRLESWSHDHLVLVQADLHDLREGTSTRDVYALETRTLGVRVNRTRVAIPLRQVVAVSGLEHLNA